jgi:hypothetical protein
MRDFKGMKRQRNRGRGGGGKPQHNANRAFDSNGPDGVKVRGAAQHIYEKYQQLARDAASSGDRVLAENYLQHAEHYFRVLRAMQPQRPVGEIIGRDQFASGYDIDFEEEPQGQELAEEGEGEAVEFAQGPRRDERPWAREDRQRDDRQRDDRQRDDRQRDERPRDEFRGRDDRFREERRERFNRDDRQGRFRDDRPPRPDREPRPERDHPLNVIEPQGSPFEPAPTIEPAPAQGAGVLRGEDGAISHAPAFLQAPRSAEQRAEGEELTPEPRPRRRRQPRNFEPTEPTPAEADEG